MTTKETTDFLNDQSLQVMLKLLRAETPSEHVKYKKILREIQGRIKSHLKTIDSILDQ
jgi:hypothetical protein